MTRPVEGPSKSKFRLTGREAISESRPVLDCIRVQVTRRFEDITIDYKI